MPFTSHFFNTAFKKLHPHEAISQATPILLPINFQSAAKAIIKHAPINIMIVCLFTLFVSAVPLLVTWFLGYLLGHLYDLTVTTYVCFFIFILGIFLFCYASDLYNKWFNALWVLQLLPAMWNHILKLPLETIKKFSSADWVQRIQNYEFSLTTILTTALSIWISGLTMLFLLVYMAYCSLLLSSIYFFIYLILLSIKLAVLPLNAQYLNAYFADQNKVTTLLNESFMQIDKIRSANVEVSIHKKWLLQLIKAKMPIEKSTKLAIFIGLVETSVPIILLMIFYLFFYLHPQTMSTYAWLQCLICAGQLTLHFEKLSTDFLTGMHLLTGLQRFAPVASASTECYASMKQLPKFTGEISLANVSWKSPETHTLILDNVSMYIPANSFVAIVGASGAGKSTLVELLLGFYSNYSGLISIDQEDIRQLNSQWVRKQFGVVLQSTQLFAGTIFSNIAANTSITLADAWQLAKYVGLDQDINAMPMKMYTHISDYAGDSISGGQKQKILIARALATQPTVLFLDEATSALDNSSQAFIFDNLKTLKMTRLVIAHRPSTLVHADLIYVLERGRVVDSGTYHELARKL